MAVSGLLQSTVHSQGKIPSKIAITLDRVRTLRKIIRLETKRAIEHELKGDRSTGIFVLGMAIAT
ncbi:hypothetical protein QUB75_07235 [Microcoleus sp. K1-B6]|uniref:hypothetical protein n=1 Tax=unclassified Microcoleus TaxID=2642155 RepID=UPI002FD7216B